MKPLTIPLVFARKPHPRLKHGKPPQNHHNSPQPAGLWTFPYCARAVSEALQVAFGTRPEIFAYAGEVQWRLRRRMHIIHFESRVRPALVAMASSFPQIGI